MGKLRLENDTIAMGWDEGISRLVLLYKILRGRLFNSQMCRAGCGWNPTAEDFGNDLRGFAGTVHAVIGEMVRREALSVQRTEAGFVAEERTAGHGHASG